MSEENSRHEPVRLELPLPVDWVSWDAIKVLRRLHYLDHDAYLVGGCVRDLMLGRYPKDFDVATSARPREVKRAFSNCRLIGRRFRLAHVLFSGSTVEVATFRRSPDVIENLEGPVSDGELGHQRVESPVGTGGRDREVTSEVLEEPPQAAGTGTGPAGTDLLIQSDNVFGTPREDALRRDFTINGLFYDIRTATVIDWIGGIRDLEARVVRTIGEPDVRFREDPVRMLRAIRFASQLRFSIERKTWSSICLVAPDIERAAPPRILEEVYRVMRAGGAARAFRMMAAAGLLDRFLEELVPCVRHAGLEEAQCGPVVPSPGRSAPGIRFSSLGAHPAVEDVRSGATSGHAVPSPKLQDMLAALDRAALHGIVLPNHLLLAVLCIEPVLNHVREVEEGNVSETLHARAGELFDVLGARLRLARRDRELARLALLGYHKAVRQALVGRVSPGLTKKSYFSDSLVLIMLATMDGHFPKETLATLAARAQLDDHLRPLLDLALARKPKPAPRRSRRRRRNRLPGRSRGANEPGSPLEQSGGNVPDTLFPASRHDQGGEA